MRPLTPTHFIRPPKSELHSSKTLGLKGGRGGGYLYKVVQGANPETRARDVELSTSSCRGMEHFLRVQFPQGS